MVQAQDSSDPTGVVSTNPRDNETLRARDRKANAALQLRVAGADWDDIAQVIGYPTGRAALVATERALEKELRSESKDALRMMASKRLDRLLRAVWPKAINEAHPEQLQSVGKAREIIADFRKVHGLDAPTEISVHSPAAEEIQQWVSEMVGINAPALEEADIFDDEGDVIEGEWSEETG
jgi:hypothetical protein